MRPPGALSGGARDASKNRGRAAAKSTMVRPYKNGDEPSKPVSFRLPISVRDAYLNKCAAANLSPSDFFREYVLTNKTQVIAQQPKASADRRRLLFLVNKSSNNLNQLAHRANSDHLAGKLSEEAYEAILQGLEQIAQDMKAALAHVD